MNPTASCCDMTWGALCTKLNGAHVCKLAGDTTHTCLCICGARYRPTVKLPPPEPPRPPEPILGRFTPKY